MNKEDPTPFKTWTAGRKEPINFEQFRQHCEPLDIQANGRVMIIGPSFMSMEELALIEAGVADTSISDIVIIGENPLLYENFIKQFQGFHPDSIIHSEPVPTYFNYFSENPKAQFDTILFIGVPMFHPSENLTYLADHLTPKGTMYLSVNLLDASEIPPIAGLSLRVLEEPLPPHPYYGGIDYYGIIGTRI